MPISKESLWRLVRNLNPLSKVPEVLKKKQPSEQKKTLVGADDPKVLQLYAVYKTFSHESFLTQQLQESILRELSAITGNELLQSQLAQLLLTKAETAKGEYFYEFLRWFAAANRQADQELGREEPHTVAEERF